MEESGEGDLANFRFLPTRALTASEESSPSEDDAEPDRDSSKSEFGLKVNSQWVNMNHKAYHQQVW